MGSPYYSSSLYYAKKGMKNISIQKLKKALKFNPYDTRAHVALGNMYLKKGKTDQAILEFQKTIDIWPDHGTAHSKISHVYFANRQFNLALFHYDKARVLEIEFSKDFSNADGKLPGNEYGLIYLGYTSYQRLF